MCYCKWSASLSILCLAFYFYSFTSKDWRSSKVDIVILFNDAPVFIFHGYNDIYLITLDTNWSDSPCTLFCLKLTLEGYRIHFLKMPNHLLSMSEQFKTPINIGDDQFSHTLYVPKYVTYSWPDNRVHYWNIIPESIISWDGNVLIFLNAFNIEMCHNYLLELSCATSKRITLLLRE